MAGQAPFLAEKRALEEQLGKICEQLNPSDEFIKDISEEYVLGPEAKELKDKYTKMIESLLSYPEVLSVVEENGEKKVKPFRTPFYSCDRGMLWAANYLTL